MTSIPGAKQVMKEAGALATSLGIGVAGRIILVCAIGYADWNSAELLATGFTPTQLQPNMLSRSLSLSKILTVAEVWKLCNGGQLDCSMNAMALSGIVPWNKTTHPWRSQCKISDLIQIPITSCDIPYGLYVEDNAIAAMTGWSLPISFEQRVAFEVGTNTPRVLGSQNISNLAYMVLGKIIEKVTGLNYYEAVRRDVLRPIGVSDVDMVEALGAAQLKDSGAVVRLRCRWRRRERTASACGCRLSRLLRSSRANIGCAAVRRRQAKPDCRYQARETLLG